MAPVKVLKKTAKSLEKSIEKPIVKKKSMKKRNYQSFSIYIFKLLKSITNENFGISRHSMLIMNNFVNDMLEKIATEAASLVAHGKNRTMGSREVQTAVRLLIPGELAKHANIEALKAITLYHKSQDHDNK